MIRGRTLLAIVLVMSMVFQAAAGLSLPASAQEGAPSSDKESTQEVIVREFEEGEIDYATSLLYRAYAMFGDQRLPESYATDTVLAEDHGLFLEIHRNWDLLPENVQDELTPFIVRPTDPRSIFASIVTPASEAASVESGSSPEALQQDQCADGWAWGESDLHPDEFRVWIPCTRDYERDLQRAIEVIEEFWQIEIDLMGPPIPDTGGPASGDSEALDFYIVETEADLVPRDTEYRSPLGEWALAVAVPTEPYKDRASSGFMVARRSRLDDPGISLDLSHEFFHILSYAHNVDIAFGYRSRPFGTFDLLEFREYWFVEASAVWAENYIYRDRIDPVTMNREVHTRFINYFQSAGMSLHETPSRGSPDFGHIYAAYIYFLFLEQELGPQAVADVWTAMREVPQDDWDGAMAVIDAALPFETHIRDFYVRNLNLDLQPGDPISPSYTDLDPTFPEGIPPAMTVGEGDDAHLLPQAAGETPRAIPLDIPSLSASYFYFEPQDGVGQITLDLTGATPQDALDIDLIVQLSDGSWERWQPAAGEPTVICQSDPQESVAGFYMVLTNHDVDLGTRVTGDMLISSPTAPCS